jgi:hypothetical protein
MTGVFGARPRLFVNRKGRGMTKRRGAVAALMIVSVTATAALAALRSDDPPGERKLRDYMRPKLNHAQKILEGLALEDYAGIRENARSLLKLSESAEWNVLPGEDYVRHSTEFRRAVNRIATEAGKKNLDGATLAYVQMTMNCVHCHQHVRDTRRPKE